MRLVSFLSQSLRWDEITRTKSCQPVETNKALRGMQRHGIVSCHCIENEITTIHGRKRNFSKKNGMWITSTSCCQHSFKTHKKHNMKELRILFVDSCDVTTYCFCFCLPTARDLPVSQLFVLCANRQSISQTTALLVFRGCALIRYYPGGSGARYSLFRARVTKKALV